MVIPSYATTTEPTEELQEVVKVDLIPGHEFMPKRLIPNYGPVHDLTAIPQKNPAVEILLRNPTIGSFMVWTGN